MTPFLTLLLKDGISNAHQGKSAQAGVLPVCVSSHQSSAPLGTQVPSCVTAVLVGLILRLIFPFPCAFSHDLAHKKGCELILAGFLPCSRG